MKTCIQTPPIRNLTSYTKTTIFNVNKVVPVQSMSIAGSACDIRNFGYGVEEDEPEIGIEKDKQTDWH